MNFFEEQDRARRRTTELSILFVVSVVSIVIAVNVVVYALAQTAFSYRSSSAARYDSYGQPEHVAPDPTRLILGTTCITLLIIGAGSAYKTMALSGGGPSVAQLLGGRPLDPNSASDQENVLRNVVEEMSIASGVTVPRIYILDHEEGINAFAAGYTTADTVIGVTRGAIEKLNRDELQGVIGHEFSHILNGDTRINLRLIGLLNGILVISLIGYTMIRYFQFASFSRQRRSQEQSIVLGIIVLGAALCAIGSIGAFFGRLIQAAVSRQREFLADASSAQFTRNPAGLVSALKKLGAYSSGSKVMNPHSLETAHLFFANSSGFSFTSLLATHPPLIERIRRLDPTFDGQFDKAGQSHLLEEFDGHRVSLDVDQRPPMAALSFAHTAGGVMPRHLQLAASLLSSIPAPLTEAAREPFSARAVVLAMLLSDESQVQSRQLDSARQQLEPACVDELQKLYQSVAQLPEGARLALFDLTLPALRRLSPMQAGQFLPAVQASVEADGKVTLFEYALYRVLSKQLPATHPIAPAPIQYFAVGAVREDAAVLLSALASASTTQTDRAFVLGARQLDPEQPMTIVNNPGLAAIDAALKRLAESSPAVKKRLIDAAACAVAADGEVSVRESELLRAIAASLDVPLPALVSGQ